MDYEEFDSQEKVYDQKKSKIKDACVDIIEKLSEKALWKFDLGIDTPATGRTYGFATDILELEEVIEARSELGYDATYGLTKNTRVMIDGLSEVEKKEQIDRIARYVADDYSDFIEACFPSRSNGFEPDSTTKMQMKEHRSNKLGNWESSELLSRYWAKRASEKPRC